MDACIGGVLLVPIADWWLTGPRAASSDWMTPALEDALGGATRLSECGDVMTLCGDSRILESEKIMGKHVLSSASNN